MNKISARVEAIEETDIVTYIHVQIGDTPISLIKSKTPEWLGVGDKVYCTFQEAAVSVSKDCPGKVSIENCLPATLKDVRKSDSLCELTFESGIGRVVSLITSQAYELLKLEEGCLATILLRALDIHIEPLLVPLGLDEEKREEARTKDAN